jgi:hypothetical protein
VQYFRSQFDILPAHGLTIAGSILLVAQLCGCRMTTVVPRVGNNGWKGCVSGPSYWRPFSRHGVLTLFFGCGNSPMAEKGLQSLHKRSRRVGGGFGIG